MTRFTKEEIDEAFWRLHDNLNLSGRTGDWSHFGSSMTRDCTFIETELGRIGKRESLVRVLTDALADRERRPLSALQCFPVEDYFIDVPRAWVWSLWWARFKDPGDGSMHQIRVFLQLKYKGDGEFFFGETIYHPYHFKKVMRNWSNAHEAWLAEADERMTMLAMREEKAMKMAPLKLDE